MPTPAEDLAARLIRMKILIDKLEHACAETDEQREAFARLHAEIEEARRALRPVKP